MPISQFTSPLTILLDHIVLLVSHTTLQSLPDHLANHFTLAPGGTHADGLTTNKLILFRGGVYLELIAFFDHISPEQRRAHRWGNLPENTVIDWALTLHSAGEFGAVQARVRARSSDTRISYADPVPSGRVREGDGVRLEWEISLAVRGAVDEDKVGGANMAQVGVEPGWLPFWCLDRTPRDWRVPYKDEAGEVAGEGWTRHPSGVTGVKRVEVVVPEGEVEGLSGVYKAVLGEQLTSSSGWGVGVPSAGMVGGEVGLVGVASSEQTGVRLVLKGERAGRVELVPGLVVEIFED
ncbi:uncharacterized protein BP01DRAFT_391337 [Aspergillus saccharolyticus JOP 1030-1]|uniref:Glyoxalase-like domain-containing protein n=1 Tax=Aspergillus saccharolyticus JOP 1030-1 TaxID=1450539 RepID=A0A318ZEJ7_9EURO|nr:hypothetical protein BP01DRAFT_391337 [Aspergillus saccharolyticus JOP 1030-1]PYH45981.1 hypothetical protein BP01DRAFT_391337 [Aspergillus saccharolyticus JOP 1030-1]